MARYNGNMPAHPRTDKHGDGSEFIYPGLSKRELFAAMAMQGLAANWIQVWARGVGVGDYDPDRTAPQDLAAWSIAAADALLRALEEKQP